MGLPQIWKKSQLRSKFSGKLIFDNLVGLVDGIFGHRVKLFLSGRRSTGDTILFEVGL